jgi:hypothetical protein
MMCGGCVEVEVEVEVVGGQLEEEKKGWCIRRRRALSRGGSGDNRSGIGIGGVE